MMIATNRSDGWPQATTVGYVNVGLVLYCFVNRLSQKHDNIMHNPRVSIAIASDFADPRDIKGLSLGGKAEPVMDNDEYWRVYALFLGRFPQYEAWPKPYPAFTSLLRISPEIISVVDYSKEFGHSDLVAVPANDLTTHVQSHRHHWLE
jgi:nitroimidazol reductase NimA-like FMN-containing flavoprotein (pyridoxamine 5'-phosphate oxidase superfamily)